VSHSKTKESRVPKQYMLPRWESNIKDILVPCVHYLHVFHVCTINVIMSFIEMYNTTCML